MTTSHTRIHIANFDFEKIGYGHYKVRYRSSTTGKATGWKITTNMPLIDATKNEDSPKIKDLNTLKRFCKQSTNRR